MWQETRDFKDLIKLAITGIVLLMAVTSCAKDSGIWEVAVPGPQGDVGAPGADGKEGPQGPQGTVGPAANLADLQQAVAVLQAQVIVLQDALTALDGCKGGEHAHKGCKDE